MANENSALPSQKKNDIWKYAVLTLKNIVYYNIISQYKCSVSIFTSKCSIAEHNRFISKIINFITDPKLMNGNVDQLYLGLLFLL